MLQSCHRHGPSAIVFLPSLCWGRSTGAVHPQSLPARFIHLASPFVAAGCSSWVNQNRCAVSCSNCSLTEPPEKPSGLRATRNAACDDKQVLPYCLLEQCMLQVALRRSRGKNCLSSMIINLETVRVSKVRWSLLYPKLQLPIHVRDCFVSFACLSNTPYVNWWCKVVVVIFGVIPDRFLSSVPQHPLCHINIKIIC